MPEPLNSEARVVLLYCKDEASAQKVVDRYAGLGYLAETGSIGDDEETLRFLEGGGELFDAKTEAV